MGAFNGSCYRCCVVVGGSLLEFGPVTSSRFLWNAAFLRMSLLLSPLQMKSMEIEMKFSLKIVC